MKAVINGIRVEGTPSEIAEFYVLCKPPVLKNNINIKNIDVSTRVPGNILAFERIKSTWGPKNYDGKK
jgi:hypothetical protein